MNGATTGATTGAAILGLAGPVLGTEEAAFFRRADPWGFILFARNIDTPARLKRLTADLRDAVGRDAPIFIDQEGGRVQRLRPPHWRAWPAPLDQVNAMIARGAGVGAVLRGLWLRGRLIAAELSEMGIDANCAPGVDLARPETHDFLKNRCLGRQPAEVGARARALAAGLMAGGVLPVIKHIPGHGRARADSHQTLPVVTASAEDLSRSDFAAFAALRDMPMAMTAHIRFTAFDAAHPATQSRRMIGAIRDRIGFRGLLMTDDLSMQALEGSLGARTAAAIGAGCDVALHCNGDPGEMAEVVAAAGRLEGAALARAEAALAQRRPPADADLPALWAEFQRLTGWEPAEPVAG
ncbi:glycoside hydrolase family 3 N-terminal domain-containing protein [Phaeovulum vinaykumarii]|nr:glycoside hydrolase family 3 N-terminal domain-containing protein [Phaeovulum vinaykumarii]